MFLLAILIGIYSYLIFALGLLGILYKRYIITITILFIFITLFYKKDSLFKFVRNFFSQFSSLILRIKKDKIFILCFLLLFFQAVVNLTGAVGPELAFDALWYHLTLPKIYLHYHKIFFIPGGILYYSAMPKLVEMLYVSALTFDSETLAKIIQFSFGILTSLALYKLSRKFFNATVSLIAVVIFYSNLVVAWESITAYADLARTFFEVLGLWAFINWIEKQKKKYFFISAIMIGFAVTTKLLAVATSAIFMILIVIYHFQRKEKFTKQIMRALSYLFIVLLIPIPWFIFSFINTGNPFYPFFTKTYPVSSSIYLLHPLRFFQSIWNVFTHAADPISPVYIAFLPLLVFGIIRSRTSKTDKLKLVSLYSCLSLVIWYITPDTGGGRFILPYLSVYSLLIVSIFTYKYSAFLKKFLMGIVIFTACISIIYRGFANMKYIPVIFGKETKEHFLTNHLNFSFGDFYDVDGYFKTHIKPRDKVLLYGFHNLYYVDFPFVDNSWVKKGERFNYIAIQNGAVPKRFANLILVYENKKTSVLLYRGERKEWISY